MNTHRFLVQAWRDMQAAPYKSLSIKVPDSHMEDPGNFIHQTPQFRNCDHISYENRCTCIDCASKRMAEEADSAYCREHDC